YQILRNDPDVEIAEPGYSNAPVSHALNLSAQGELLDIIPLYVQDQKGKERPRQMNVPMRIKRSVNVAANFLCDNPVYVLGITDKEAKDPDYAKKRFEEFRKHNLEILAKVNSPAACAITTFLKNHDPLKATQIPVVARHLESLLQGRNLIFLVEGKNTLDDSKIRQAWEEYHLGHETLEMQCLVTGEIEPVARLHPDIKGVWGAQRKGAALVSFNLDAFTSYGREQGLNSPISRRAAAGYGVALNYLLSRRDPRPLHTSDTTVVFWAESESRQTEAVFACLFDPDSLSRDSGQPRRGGQAEGALKTIAQRVRAGKPLDLDALLADLGDENPRFYVLGLAPNASRLAVRFFITDPFRQMVANVMAHYRDLQIVKE
ncbi:MAG: type I-C CRISPR-associated protein Cas8c/Csd1, partial [Gammaproteobacteria bacterium]